MTSHPADVVYIDGSDVSKAVVRSYDKLRTRIRVADAAEVRSTDLSGQHGGIYVAALGSNFDLDTSDALTADDGITCIRDSAGNGFFIAAGTGSARLDAIAALALPGYNTAIWLDAAGVAGLMPIGPGAYGIVQQDENGKLTGYGIRESLSANRTYYVRTDGSNSNDGLSNTAGGAFLTIQKAIDTVAALDIKTYNVTIHVADGTYTGTITCNGPWMGSGTVTLIGNNGTPANCLISTTAQLLTVKNGASLIISGFKVTTTAGHMMECLYHGALEYSDLEFGSAGVAAHVRATDGGKIKCTGPCTISGAAGQHWAAVGVGAMIRCQSKTITITGTPAFAWQFCNVQYGGGAIVDGCTFSGSATGPRYNAASQGFIYTAGAGTSYLPGNSAGSGTNPSASPYGLYY